MIIDTSLGMRFHQNRMEQMRDTADQKRLITNLTRQSRSFSFKLGTLRVNLIRETTPHVPRMA